MRKIVKWIDEYLEEGLLVISLGAMAVIMGIQVFSRYALGASLSWSEELTRYLFIWAGFLSVSYCTKRCISIKIEQFVALFPKRGRAMFKVANHTVELILFLYLLPFAWKYFMSAVENGQVSPAMGIPMYYVQAAPFVGFILWCNPYFSKMDCRVEECLGEEGRIGCRRLLYFLYLSSV